MNLEQIKRDISLYVLENANSFIPKLENLDLYQSEFRYKRKKIFGLRGQGLVKYLPKIFIMY